MRDFPADKSISPQEAFTIVQSRFQGFEQIQSSVGTLIRSKKTELSSTFFGLCRLLHRLLFHEILHNAGSFRQTTEPNRGYVGFGKSDVRKPSGAQFDGTPADQIEEKLKTVFTLLAWEDTDPIRTSAIFYQRFVRIHPFYDANGRIGRALVTIYLRLHGYYFLWRKLETTSKHDFIKKLNDCHKRENSYTLREYEDILVHFWEKFVVRVSEIEG